MKKGEIQKEEGRRKGRNRGKKKKKQQENKGDKNSKHKGCTYQKIMPKSSEFW